MQILQQFLFSLFFHNFNPYAAELSAAIFHFFEAWIPNAIPSFKWQKLFLFIKKFICKLFD